MNGAILKHKRNHKLFRASTSLKLVAIAILLPLHKTIENNQYGVVVTYRYCKLARATPTAFITTRIVATYFCTIGLSHIKCQCISHRTIARSLQACPSSHSVHTLVQSNEPQLLLTLRQMGRQNGTSKQF